MSHTNTTTNYGLPQFVTTDKPFWLTDVNQAYADIDAAMKNNEDTASTAASDATQALYDASAAATTASGADAKAAGAIASIANTFTTTDTYLVGDMVIYNNLLYRCTSAVTTPGAWTGSTNWARITLEDEDINIKNIIADSWSSTTTYETGAYVIYNNALYRSLVDNNVNVIPEGSSASWFQMKVMDDNNSIVVKRTLTETTSSNGNIVNYIDVLNGIVVAAYCTSQEATVTPFINNLGTHYSFHVSTPTSAHAVVANAQVTIDFYMIPRRRIVNA